MKRLFLALLLFIFQTATLTPLMAEPNTAERCDWADCDQSLNSASPWQAPIGAMSICGNDDKLACAEECRREFDSQYHRCVDSCLGKRCVIPTPTPKESSTDDLASPCVEIESPVCDDNCKREIDSRRPRCRRDCLQKACPSASQNDIATESMDPGSFRCDRCRKKFQMDCVRQCSLGMIGSYPGLAQFGCEKACVMTYCGKSCGPRLPF